MIYIKKLFLNLNVNDFILNIPAILDNNIIEFNDNGINYKFDIFSFVLERKNKEFTSILDFKNKESIYYLNSLSDSNKIYSKIVIKELINKNTSVIINYRIEDEEFKFNLSYREVNNMDILLELKKAILDSLKSDNITLDDIVIEVPSHKEHGDFSTNIALKCSKKLNMKPIDIANNIVNNISCNLINNIEIVNPGFINIFVNKDYLLDNINIILEQNNNYGRSDIGNNKKIDVEFVSVNPTGSIHLGHARGACYGDSLCNILAFNSFIPTREYYINDAGNQMNNMALSIKERYKELCGLECNMQENYYYGKEIIAVAKNMYEEQKDGYLNADISIFWQKGLDYFLGNIKKDLSNINVNFDVWTSEKDLRNRELVTKALEKLEDLGYTYEQDGAIYLKTSLFGDDKDRVIIKKDGLYTYFMPDIAYHLDKLNRGFDNLIDVLGADHHGYINRLMAAVTMLGGDSKKLDVKIIQMVRAIKDGEEYKLSKRTGNSITLNDLVLESGVDAIRYFFVSKSIDTQMDFDVSLANRKTNDNPVYYVQYAHARICSILKNYNNISFEKDYKFETINSDCAYNVLEKLYEFQHIIEVSALKKAPHLITNYVYELASLFHSYYGNEKIVSDDEKYTKERLMLITAVKIVIANALKLVGVSAPERM